MTEANGTGGADAERRAFLARAGKIAAAAPAAALLLRASEVSAQGAQASTTITTQDGAPF